MSTRTALGWQTMLADLALILFMVTAAAMADKPEPARKPAPKPVGQSPLSAALADPARAQPLALWRDGPGGPPLREWLASQQADARTQLTITYRYAPDQLGQAATKAAALAQTAGTYQHVRIILEPVARVQDQGALAAITYDRAG